MVDLLIFGHAGIESWFNGTYTPGKGPWFNSIWSGGLVLSKPIILKSVPDYPGIITQEFEIVSSIWRFVGSDTDWIDVRSEYQIFLIDPFGYLSVDVGIT